MLVRGVPYPERVVIDGNMLGIHCHCGETGIRSVSSLCKHSHWRQTLSARKPHGAWILRLDHLLPAQVHTCHRPCPLK